MEDKLHRLFAENDFDIHEPHTGHLDRFERKLQHPKQKNVSWRWMSIAASIILLLGFWLGNISKTEERVDLKDLSPTMAETQAYFVNTINQEMKELERNRTLETETLIEQALEDLEELEENYKNFVKDLSKNNNETRIIQAMIGNYQQRLEILETVLQQIEQIKNPNNSFKNETII